MQNLDFYAEVAAAMRSNPSVRHARLLVVHRESLADYKRALMRVSDDVAGSSQPGSNDVRTIAEIIAHIEAWDRFALMAVGDLLAGIRHPRMVTDLAGYVESDGTPLTFASIDAFNEYQAVKARKLSWDTLKEKAIWSAAALYALFEHPSLLSASRLEASNLHRKRLHNGTVLEQIPMGWHLWLTMIEHIAAEHRSMLDWLGGTDG